MDAQTVTTMTTTVGFPIVMCFLLWCQMRQDNENHKAEVDSLKDMMSDVKVAITELRDAINNMRD